MNHLFSSYEIGMVTSAGKIFKKQTNLNVDTYCYMISRMYEAALKGESSVTISGEGYSDIQEIADIIAGTLTNCVYITWDPSRDELRMSWRQIY